MSGMSYSEIMTLKGAIFFPGRRSKKPFTLPSMLLRVGNVIPQEHGAPKPCDQSPIAKRIKGIAGGPRSVMTSSISSPGPATAPLPTSLRIR